MAAVISYGESAIAVITEGMVMLIAKIKVRQHRLELAVGLLGLLLAFAAPAQTVSPWVTTSNEQGQILVFVSSSMPRASLTQWFMQAERFKASVVLRGFVNNSLPATKAWLTPIVEASGQGGIEINPVAFEAYGITQVPAVVVTLGTLRCVSDQECIAPPFDSVIGNTSLAEALKVIEKRGEVGHLVAKQKLAKLKELHHE
jgi:type-F conjugative transfer system pilin assembly protein TrbC